MQVHNSYPKQIPITDDLKGMILADFGADVIRIDRPDGKNDMDILSRGKRSIAIDLKQEAGRQLLLKMIAGSDVVIDPFRPGVMERLGVGPNVFLGDDGLNKKLIYARVAGSENLNRIVLDNF